MKRTRIRPRSAKMAAKMVERRLVLAQLVDERGDRCEYVEEGHRCTSQAQDGHERLRRSAGGSITDPQNIILLCRSHHRFVTDHPAQAIRDGWAVSRFRSPFT